VSVQRLVGRSARNLAPPGMSLVELLLAMTIGVVLLGAAVTAYLKSRETYAATETLARLQEVARYALGVIESDVRMSGHLGLMSEPAVVSNLDGPLTGPGGESVAFEGCTENWATRVADPLSGWDQSDGAWPFGSGCRPFGRWRDTTDGLIVRRASADRIPQDASALKALRGHVLIASSRNAAQVFVGDADGRIPAAYAQSDPPDEPPRADTRRLLVNAYYVGTDSTAEKGHPSLRRKRLVAGPAVQDEEIMPGVEDLQVQYGVDTDGDGSADRYLNAGDLEAGSSVVSARLWLRVRAADRDPAYTDDRRYVYANQDERVPRAERQFRRVLVSRTVYLRNAADP